MVSSLLAFAILVALTSAALAQEGAAPKLSAKTSTIGEILDNDEARIVFFKLFPELADMDELDSVRDSLLDDFRGTVPDVFSDAKLAELDAGLSSIAPFLAPPPGSRLALRSPKMTIEQIDRDLRGRWDALESATTFGRASSIGNVRYEAPVVNALEELVMVASAARDANNQPEARRVRKAVRYRI